MCGNIATGCGYDVSQSSLDSVADLIGAWVDLGGHALLKSEHFLALEGTLELNTLIAAQDAQLSSSRQRRRAFGPDQDR